MSEYSVKELVFNHEKAFKPEVAEGVDAVIQYRFTGEEGGDYIITIKDSKCSVAEGVAEAVLERRVDLLSPAQMVLQPAVDQHDGRGVGPTPFADVQRQAAMAGDGVDVHHHSSP